ncbi:MAG: ribonuclease HII [Candidatus Nanoarchaeia archaeon]|nr:ribonuclease HII [Candidatus Nanoarchaeia archaeon]
MALICGIDEAGKGPVIGDLVVCGVLISNNKSFDGLGVDSKSISPKKREELFCKVVNLCDKYVIKRIKASDIDCENKKGVNLNTVELIRIAQIINELKPDVAYIDCPHPVPEKFTNELRKNLINKDVKIVAEHKADSKYSIVGAASIIAKVTRDESIKKIEKDYSVIIGSGYPSDPVTKDFVMKYLNGEHGELKEFVRHSWSTIKLKRKADGQLRLF